MPIQDYLEQERFAASVFDREATSPVDLLVAIRIINTVMVPIANTPYLKAGLQWVINELVDQAMEKIFELDTISATKEQTKYPPGIR